MSSYKVTISHQRNINLKLWLLFYHILSKNLARIFYKTTLFAACSENAFSWNNSRLRTCHAYLNTVLLLSALVSFNVLSMDAVKISWSPVLLNFASRIGFWCIRMYSLERDSNEQTCEEYVYRGNENRWVNF